MSAKPGQLVGAKNPNWRGGRVVDPRGYILIRVGIGHPLADVRGYAYEHRLVASRNGSVVGKQVHHRDEDKGNNASPNLEPLTFHEHRAQHRKQDSGLRQPGEPNALVACACGCTITFTKFDSAGRARVYLPGHNPAASPTADAVLAALASGETLTREQIVARSGRAMRAVATCLSSLKRRGAVANVGIGKWCIRG
jgi:hypothetical protein